MSQDRVPVVSIVGHHDSGKTTLIANLLPVLVARGLRVGTVKHAPHLAALDASRSDSARHFEAGASRVLLLGENTSALFWAHDDSPLSADIDRLFAGCDLVLIEGGKAHPYPRIEVFRRGRELTREPLAGQIDVACVITDERVALPDGLAVIPPRDLERIADLVEQLAFEI